MILRAVDAAAAWPTLVVASSAVAAELRAAGANVRIVENDAPERGMNQSLKLADAVIPRDEPIAVMLGDLPDASAATVARVIGAYDEECDTLAPRFGERLGHPVVFGPVARGGIAALPDGDLLRTIRGDATLRHRTVEMEDASAFDDIDTEAELAAHLERRASRS